MSSLTEGELEFVFEGAVSARKFDGHDVEIKDPQDSRAPETCKILPKPGPGSQPWVRLMVQERFTL